MRTPSQTVGPYYELGCCRRPDNELVPGGVELRGCLYDGQGEAIWDGMIELFDPVGRHWGRSGTHPSGEFSFVVPDGVDYVYAYVFARGLLRHQLTRTYFRDTGDDLLTSLSADERATLLAERAGDAYRFDIHMQGPKATVFFEH
jgi:protocatechuate 3,4-dioxygenase alpha subunit